MPSWSWKRSRRAPARRWASPVSRPKTQRSRPWSSCCSAPLSFLNAHVSTKRQFVITVMPARASATPCMHACRRTEPCEALNTKRAPPVRNPRWNPSQMTSLMARAALGARSGAELEARRRHLESSTSEGCQLERVVRQRCAETPRQPRHTQRETNREASWVRGRHVWVEPTLASQGRRGYIPAVGSVAFFALMHRHRASMFLVLSVVTLGSVHGQQSSCPCLNAASLAE